MTIPNQQKRSFQFTLERNERESDTRKIVLSFSSEEPCERSFGIEILDHSQPDSVDFSRLQSKAPLLLEHDTNRQIGVVQEAWLDPATKKGRAVVRFSKSALATEVLQDVKDGIRSLVSVGYDIGKAKVERADGGKTYRFKGWQPYEISIVSVPFDTNVGIGRNLPKTSHMETTEIQDQNNNQSHNRNTQALGYERERCLNINAIAQRAANVPGVTELAQKYLQSGASSDQFAREVLELRGPAKPFTPYSGDFHRTIGMDGNQLERYNFCKAIVESSENRLSGLEAEVSKEMSRKFGRNAVGFFVPPDVIVAKRTLNVNSAPAGGYTVDTNSAGQSMIELLRNNMLVTQLGARMLNGLQGNVSIPRHVGASTAFWQSEVSETDESEQEFGALNMTPKCVSGYTTYSKELLMQSSIDVESFVRLDLTTVLALAKDLAFINGSGATGEPLGLMGTTGINSVTFGGAPTWASVLEFEEAIDTDNVPLQSLAFLSTPGTRKKWKQTVKESGQAIYLLDDQGRAAGHRFMSTKQVPSDKVLFGNWSNLIIGTWNALDIVTDPYTMARQRKIGITVSSWTDCALRHPVSFAVSTDAGNQ